MLKISKSGNSILVEGIENNFYVDNGKLTFPSNSLILTIDESDMATFRSAANNDVMFSGLIENITISDEAVTKDDIISKFGVIAYSTSGGGGTGAVSSVNGQTGDVVITASSLGAATKADLDNYATKDELDEKQEVFQVNAPMSFSRDEATQDLHLSIDLSGYATKSEIPDVSDMETKTDAAATYQPKGDYATKTELGNVSAEVEYKADKSDVYTMQEVDAKLNGKQNTLTAGSNITLSEPDPTTGNVTISSTGGSEPVDAYTKEESDNRFQGKLTAGTNITISEDNVISATGGGESGVTSVNGQTGEVVLDIPTAQVGQDGSSSNYVYSDTNNRVIRKLNVLELSSSIQLQAVYWGGNGYDGSGIISGATTSKAGVMSSADKTKLDSIDTAEIEQVIGDVAALQTDVEGKQDTLVSGTNIKTINGESVLGSGDIVISGGGSTDWNDITNKPTIPSVQGGSSGTNVQYIYSSKDSLNYRSVASQRLVQKGGYTSMEYWYWGQSEKEATIMDFPYATSSNGGSMSPSDKSKLDGIPSMSVLTQAEYDALPSKDANTLYFIKE
jgi:hypothetical protein